MHLCKTARRCRAEKNEGSLSVKRRPGTARRPKLLLAHRDRAYRIRARGHFHWKDVDFLTATSVEEVHELTQRYKPGVVVIDGNLPGESGYLTCAKIKLTLPRCKVVLLGRDTAEEFAEFVGAERIAERAPDPRRLAALAS